MSTAEHQGHTGCTAAGFTRCCAFGACRVDLPDGGHCFCDQECLNHNSYPHHNCCSDNPCEGLSLEKYNYFVSEGDGFVEVCGNLYGRQGLTVDVRFSTSSSSARAGRDFIHVREVLQMTSGERKCWNITILDDSISESQLTHYVGVKQFYIYLRPLRASVGSASAWVYIRDIDRGMCSS